ncbi:MAG TPA: hypothetical protein ENI23_10790 [bacterium]|nr:hypothetical protein [bacterium]
MVRLEKLIELMQKEVNELHQLLSKPQISSNQYLQEFWREDVQNRCKTLVSFSNVLDTFETAHIIMGIIEDED